MFIKKFALFFLCLLPLNINALNRAPIDITTMDINDLSIALNEGLITSELLVNLYLDRIQTYDDYNAIITVNENAIKEAKKLDKERNIGKVRSKLHGIPIIVKDNIDVVGMPTTAGAKALNDNYPNEDAFVIKKLKEAGAIILAKSNMSEFAFQASSSRSSFGTVKNAYNINYSSYGSSGGSAVSVALNLAPAALGTDTNSSVRVPASAANIIGYRPTLGLFSRSGVLPYDPERDTIGLLTKTINDSILLTNIIKGYDNQDSKSLNDNIIININKDSFENTIIGVPNNFLKGNNNNILSENKETYKEIYNLMLNLISKLEKNGATIIYLDDYYTYTENNYSTSTYSGYLFCDSFNNYIKNHQSNINNFSALTKDGSKITDLSGYETECYNKKSLDKKNELKNKYATLLTKLYKDNNLDVIIYPTTKNKLLKIGESGIINLSAHAASTVGFPAISMPLGFDKDMLPYGVELMALKKEDNKLLNIALSIENINLNKVLPSNTQSLYSIDANVIDLINNYHSNKRFLFKKSWNKKAKKYFSTYNFNKNYINDAKILNKEYVKRIIINYIYKLFFICLMYYYLKPKTVKYLK